MNFSAEDFRAHVVALREKLAVAGAERIAAIEEGDFHMSFHFQGVGAQWWDVGARGSIAYAVISENQPEELLRGRHWNTLRRSNVNTINSWTVHFFPDGERFYVAHGDPLPDCYRNAVAQWLRVHVRNQAGGGLDPPVADDIGEPNASVPVDEDEWVAGGGGGHANSGAAESR